ncbi:PBECR2 nuclease fold domain-containing protein [Castellaniella hirudinis]|uniref:PBECR2 nuclease fold domain-containing protein n=1 Tax=Castellaniella hirudinis TaxID=1144617 RepID=UPI0039C0CDAD
MAFDARAARLLRPGRYITIDEQPGLRLKASKQWEVPRKRRDDGIDLVLEKKEQCQSRDAPATIRSGGPTVRVAVGECLIVGADLFRDACGRWKATNRGREQYLLMLADALRDPDEGWVRIEWLYSENKAVVRRRYAARYEIEGQAAPALSVFDIGPDG